VVEENVTLVNQNKTTHAQNHPKREKESQSSADLATTIPKGRLIREGSRNCNKRKEKNIDETAELSFGPKKKEHEVEV